MQTRLYIFLILVEFLEVYGRMKRVGSVLSRSELDPLPLHILS